MAWCFFWTVFSHDFSQGVGLLSNNWLVREIWSTESHADCPSNAPSCLIIIAMASPHFLLLSDDADEVFVASCVALWQNMRWTEEGEILGMPIQYYAPSLIDSIWVEWKKLVLFANLIVCSEKVCFLGSNQHYLVRGMNSFVNSKGDLCLDKYLPERLNIQFHWHLLTLIWKVISYPLQTNTKEDQKDDKAFVEEHWLRPDFLCSLLCARCRLRIDQLCHTFFEGVKNHVFVL